MCHCFLCKDLLSSVFGPCDSSILNFEFYVFVFGLYCFGLAHYRGRGWIILSYVSQTIIYKTVQFVYMQISRKSHAMMRDNNYNTAFSYQHKKSYIPLYLDLYPLYTYSTNPPFINTSLDF